MDFKTAVNSALTNFINFEGRASRSEYWWFFLFYVIVYIGALIIDSVLSLGVLGLLVTLGLLAPSLAVGARRLHDINKSGWWQLLCLIPLVGFLILIYFYVQKSDAGTNRFGAPTAA